MDKKYSSEGKFTPDFMFYIALVMTIAFLMLRLDGAVSWTWLTCVLPLIFWLLGHLIAVVVMLLLLLYMKIADKIEDRRMNKDRVMNSGTRMVWDSKTQTMYGAPEVEEQTWTVLSYYESAVVHTRVFRSYDSAHSFALKGNYVRDYVEIRDDKTGKIVWSCNIDEGKEV